MSRQLVVWFNHHIVGRLTETRNIWSFQYDDAWLVAEEGFDLSPSLPRQEGILMDGSTTRPVQWFFDNLLPEEQARELMAKNKNFESSDSFSMLAYYGQESAGALTLLGEDEVIVEQGMRPLEFSELSERIRKLPVAPLSSNSAKRMSLAGAQHKLAVIYRDSALLEPVGNTVSTHILKPDHQHPDHYPHTVVNEWFVMQLAKRVGLNVPETYFMRVPESIYLIDRFDRLVSDENALLRRHTLDGCQLLSVSGFAKYPESTIENLNKLIEYCRTKATARQELFKWMLFNTIVGNGDAHLKNLSVFCENKGMMLTPHYDLLSTTIYEEPGRWGEAKLSWPLGDAEHFNEVKRNDLVTFGKEVGLKERFIDRTIDSMLTRIEGEANQLLEETGAKEGDKKPTAGEMRHLRQIVLGVMKDMLSQLS